MSMHIRRFLAVSVAGLCIGAGALAAPAQVGSAGAQAANVPVAGPLKLSNPQASKQAAAVFQYIVDGYGKQTLTGQQESTWMPAGPRYELDYIREKTGKLPAILGLDYINPKDYDALNIRAEKWYKEEGGIVTICWHWGSPEVGTGYVNSKIHFDVEAALQDGTPQNKAMMRDMDIIASKLAVLRDKGVPVLWRPFHEFTGTWFWWGQSGSENFKRLWIKMYNYYTVTKGLNNLVWVLGYTGEPDANYYPGDRYVDIAGADDYVKDHGSLKPMYDKVVAIVGSRRPIALHENGPIPDPDLVLRDGANWSYFMTWHTEWITEGKHNTADDLKKAYNHPRYVTKDRLPTFFVPEKK